MSIKKLLLSIIGLGLSASSAVAVTNGPVAISSGSAFYNVDISSLSNKNVRQNIVIGDPSLVSGVAPVSSVTGLTVNLASSTAVVGTVVISSANGVSGSTIAVTNAGGNALIVDGSGVTQPVSGTFWQATQPISGSVTTIQGTPGTLDWVVRMSSTDVSQSTITIMAPNNNTTPIPITGSLSTTAGAQSIVAVDGSTMSVGYQTGTSSVPVNVLNTVAITGSISNTSFAISTGGITAAQGPAGTQDWSVKVTSVVVKTSGGGTNLGVDLSTGVLVKTSGGGSNLGVDFSTGVRVNVIQQSTVLGATVTYNGTQSVDVGTFHQSTVIGATVTYNGTQSVDIGSIHQGTVLGATVTIQGNAVGTPVYTYTTNTSSMVFSPGSVQLSSVTINLSSTGDTVIVSTQSAKSIRLYRLFIVTSAATTLYFRDSGIGDKLTGPMTMTSGGSIVLDFSGEPWFATTAGNGLFINQTGTAVIAGRAYFTAI